MNVILSEKNQQPAKTLLIALSLALHYSPGDSTWLVLSYLELFQIYVANCYSMGLKLSIGNWIYGPLHSRWLHNNTLALGPILGNHVKPCVWDMTNVTSVSLSVCVCGCLRT